MTVGHVTRHVCDVSKTQCQLWFSCVTVRRDNLEWQVIRDKANSDCFTMCIRIRVSRFGIKYKVVAVKPSSTERDRVPN